MTRLHRALEHAAEKNSLNPSLSEAFRLLALEYDPDFKVKERIDQAAALRRRDHSLPEDPDFGVKGSPPDDEPWKAMRREYDQGCWSWTVARLGWNTIHITTEGNTLNLPAENVAHILANALNREAT